MYPERENAGHLTTDKIEKYISRNYDMLKLSHNYLGVWYDNGTWVYDICKCIVNLDDALAAAKHYKQDAIFDIAAGEEMFLTKHSFEPVFEE